MDAVEYLKERERILPKMSSESEMLLFRTERRDPQKAVDIISAWVAQYPRMTNAQKFEEVFGAKPENMCQPMDWWDAEYKEPGVNT